jgi:hypothetical protein
VCSVMRLTARWLRPGTFSMLDGDLLMAETLGFFVPCAALRLRAAETDVPSPLSETSLSDVWRAWGRMMRRSRWAGSAMAGSTMGRSTRPSGSGRLWSRYDFLGLGSVELRDRDLSKSSTIIATRRRWASTTSSRFVWHLRIDGGVKEQDAVLEDVGLVGEWKVGLFRRDIVVFSGGAVLTSLPG